MYKLSSQELQFISGGAEFGLDPLEAEKILGIPGLYVALMINVWRSKVVSPDPSSRGMGLCAINALNVCQKTLDPIKEIAASYDVPTYILYRIGAVAHFGCACAVELISPCDHKIV